MAKTTENFSNGKRELAKGFLALGQLGKNPLEAISSASKIVAGLVQGQGASIFSLVVEDLASKGEIDREFISKSKGRYFFQEITDAIKTEDRDEEAIEYKIKIFLSIVSKKFINSDEDEAKEVWIIVKNLSVKDIRLLATVFKLSKSAKHTVFGSENAWDEFMTEQTGLKYMEFIEQSRNSLHVRRLLTTEYNRHYGLSKLGICVSEYLIEGERLYSLVHNK